MCLALSILSTVSGLVSRAAALAVVASLLTQTAFAAGAGETVAALEAKGVKFKKEKDGTVSGVFIGPAATLTLDDLRAIGKLPALRQLNLSPKAPPPNDEMLAALGTLDTVEIFFANGAKFTDEGFKVFATWKNLQRFGLDHWGCSRRRTRSWSGPAWIPGRLAEVDLVASGRLSHRRHRGDGGGKDYQPGNLRYSARRHHQRRRGPVGDLAEAARSGLPTACGSRISRSST